ncbi:PQQ-like domain-containing protein [Arachidicoccus rhizosphaerae]|jgi:hypothetical protein|uniref:PQQ-like domain-containing protein n=1 Tax=Arachidicoccus rhizosphaerae TaxID=551991 RepID=A0A1H3Y395_9BACT|nr:PQQ-binding-like beta-propeller repeat protein [Arachidicoccus rhizosphaerae]SEA06197.1 PQQ-like domain-containing protein [Arachidicoccus rhizosphaerae]
MEIKWTVRIPDPNPHSFDHVCEPIIWNNLLYYAFITVDKTKVESGYYGSKIIVLAIEPDGTSCIQKEYFMSYRQQKGKLLAPRDWKFSENNNQLLLHTGLTFIISEPDILKSEKHIQLEENHVQSEYRFGDKKIKYNQRSKLACFDLPSGKLLWEQVIKAYLYTDVEVKGDLIFFGTSGKGGAFYCLNLIDGSIVTEYNNGGASDYCWFGQCVFLKDKKRNLVKINATSMEVMDTLALKNKIPFNSKIFIHGNSLYVTTLNKKADQLELICVAI